MFWATAVLLLAAAMRLIALDQVPPGLAQDEVLNADIVTYIRGGYHALFFREGYGHEPLYHYWSVPFQVLLGDNVLSIRLPAVFLGLFVVAGALRWGKRDFGQVVALLAGAFLAISWWPIIFSRIGLRPIMEPLLLLGFAWFFPKRPWLAGLFLGLSLYSYTGARVMFLWPVLLAAYWLWHGRKKDTHEVNLLGRAWPAPFLAAVTALLVALLIYAPLAWALRVDPSLQQRVQQLDGPLQALAQGQIEPILSTTLATLGVFSFTGDPRWTYMLPGVPLFDMLTAVFFYAGLLLVIWRLARPPYAVLLSWLLVGLLPSALTPEAPSTVRLIGALPAVYILPALPLAWLWVRRGTLVTGGRERPWLRYGVPLLVVGLLALNLGRTLQNGFVRWPAALETRLKYQTVLSHMAAYLEENPVRDLVIADGFYRPITADSLRRDLGSDPQARWVQTGGEVAGALVLPAHGEGKLLVPEFAAPDPALFAAAGISDRPLFRSAERPSFAVYLLPAAPSSDEQVLANFEGKISLVGYEIPPGSDGAALQIVTVWRVNSELLDDLAIFVHWQDGDGVLLSQHDGFDAAPATLQIGDIVVQRHILPWPDVSPTSPTALSIGLYERDDGRRLERVDPFADGTDALVIPLSADLMDPLEES
jgi:hypothetical protein